MADELSCVCRTRLASGFELDARLVLTLDRHPITVLFGPSGAGKTTLLRMIAGLDCPSAGVITFRGSAWFDSARAIHQPPQQRRAVFLAQEYALFPHLTVAANVAYAVHKDDRADYLAKFGLTELACRLPRELSSGQRQRVALARAIAARPALLLLDEPLSALDASTRARTRRSLRELLMASGIPSVIVTHDRMEAAALGDGIVVMTGGSVRQSGAIGEVFQHPADAQVAESMGVENVLPGRVVGRHGGVVELETGGAILQAVDGGEDGSVVACVRAEDVAITRDLASASSARNRLVGRVTSVTPEGPLARVYLDCGFPLVAAITAQSATEMRLAAGDEVCAIVKTTSVHLAAH